jgi:hypothetical protein
MAVTVNGAASSNAQAGNTTAGVARTFNYTCPPKTDCLAFLEGSANSTTNTLLTVPAKFTYGRVALNLVPDSVALLPSTNGYSMTCSIWYILGPPQGSQVVSLTYSEVRNYGEVLMVPLTGCGAAGTGTAGSPGNGDPYAWAAQNAGANDLYLGIMQCGSSSLTFTPTGTGQTKLVQVTSLSVMNASADSISGSNPGAFGWTTGGSGAGGIAAAAPFFAFGTATTTIAKAPPRGWRRRPAGINSYELNPKLWF